MVYENHIIIFIYLPKLGCNLMTVRFLNFTANILYVLQAICHVHNFLNFRL